MRCPLLNSEKTDIVDVDAARIQMPHVVTKSKLDPKKSRLPIELRFIHQGWMKVERSSVIRVANQVSFFIIAAENGTDLIDVRSVPRNETTSSPSKTGHGNRRETEHH